MSNQKLPRRSCLECGGKIFELHKESANMEIKIVKRFKDGGKFEITAKDLCENCASKLVEQWVVDWLKLFKGDLKYEEFSAKYHVKKQETTA